MAVTPKSFLNPRVLVVLLAMLAVPGALIFGSLHGQCARTAQAPEPATIEMVHVEEAEPTFEQGFLGIGIQTVDARRIHPRCNRAIAPGVLVARVIEDMSAYNAGIAPNDIITHVDGNRVTEAPELKFLISTTPAGHKVQLTVLRNGQLLNLYPTLDAKPQAVIDAEETVAQERAAAVQHGSGCPHARR